MDVPETWHRPCPRARSHPTRSRGPNLVSIPVALLDDRRPSPRDQATLMLPIARAYNSPRCDCDVYARAHRLGGTTRTARKGLARLEGSGYLVDHKDWIELHDNLVLTDDSLLIADLPPSPDEQFARLQRADEHDAVLKDCAGRKLFLDLPRALVAGRPRPKRP